MNSVFSTLTRPRSPTVYALLLLFIAGFLTLLPATLNFAIDPLSRYGLQAPFHPIYFPDARQQMPGLARHERVPSILIGSSVAAAFAPAIIQDLSQSPTLTLSIPGATGRELSLLTGLALAQGRVKSVYFVLDWFSFATKAEALRDEQSPFPLYLYRSGLGDHLQYLFNISTLGKTAGLLLPFPALLHAPRPYATLQAWYDAQTKPPLGDNALLEMYGSPSQIDTHRRVHAERLLPSELNFRDNIRKNLVPHIRDNIDVEFNIILPPRPYLYYWFYNNNFSEFYNLISLARSIALELANEYVNVKLYDFEVDEFARALNHYSDFIHFDAVLAKRIIAGLNDPNHPFRLAPPSSDPLPASVQAWGKLLPAK